VERGNADERKCQGICCAYFGIFNIPYEHVKLCRVPPLHEVERGPGGEDSEGRTLR